MGTIRNPNRAAAIAAGHVTYMSGTPCKHGHMAPRLTSCHDCTECKRLTCQARYRADPEKWRGRHRKWVSENRELWLKICRDGAARRREHTKAAKPFLPEIVADQHGLCAGCGQKMDKPSIDHIVPVIRGGQSERSNLQALCVPCNKSKGAKTEDQWKKELWHRTGPK